MNSGVYGGMEVDKEKIANCCLERNRKGVQRRISDLQSGVVGAEVLYKI